MSVMIIDVLLSTFNSQLYLEELLKSLNDQSFKDWRLLVRDDCSTDETISILQSYHKTYPARIVLVDNEAKQLGPKKSFEKLLEYCSANYIMFCDHDDYWLPNKIQDSIDKIKELEITNAKKPSIVFTDLTIADQKLNTIHPSFWKYSKINPVNIFNTYRLAVNNPVVGCTLIINKAAKSLVLPFPKEAIMHDWWIALKVSESGIADYLNDSTILYRQHAQNEIGAEQINISFLKKRILNISQTIKQNIAAYKILKCLDLNYSIFKYTYHKLRISLSKIIR